ncbi:hypothetical protein ACFX1R_042776 [Malus domestica]
MEEKDKQKAADLIEELVISLHSINPNFKSHPPTPNSPEFQSSLYYTFCLISNRLTPSMVPNVAATAQSIKRHLTTQGKSS